MPLFGLFCPSPSCPASAELSECGTEVTDGIYGSEVGAVVVEGKAEKGENGSVRK